MPAPRARAARRALLGALAGFALLQAALLALVCRDPVLIREESWQRRVRCYRQRVADEPRALTVVQLGSSRTINALCGRTGEPILADRLGQPVVLFNFGIPGAGSPIRRRFDLERLLNDEIRPDLLLLELLPVGFDERYLTNGISADILPVNCLRLGEVRLLDRLAGEDRPGVVREWFREQGVPSRAYQIGLVGAAPRLVRSVVACERGPDIDRWGHYPIVSLHEGVAEKQLAHQNGVYGSVLEDFTFTPLASEHMSEAIVVAQQKGMRVALVVMPEGPAHRGLYPPGLWPKILALFEELAHKHGVPLLDLRETLDEEDFVDSHHPYAHGARRFTRELAGRIEPILRDIQNQKRPDRQDKR